MEGYYNFIDKTWAGFFMAQFPDPDEESDVSNPDRSTPVSKKLQKTIQIKDNNS